MSSGQACSMYIISAKHMKSHFICSIVLFIELLCSWTYVRCITQQGQSFACSFLLGRPGGSWSHVLCPGASSGRPWWGVLGRPGGEEELEAMSSFSDNLFM